MGIGSIYKRTSTWKWPKARSASRPPGSTLIPTALTVVCCPSDVRYGIPIKRRCLTQVRRAVVTGEPTLAAVMPRSREKVGRRKSRPVRSRNRAHDVKSRASVRLGLLTQGVEVDWGFDAEGRSNALPLRLMSLLLALMDRLRSSIIFRAS